MKKLASLAVVMLSALSAFAQLSSNDTGIHEHQRQLQS
jgi:hypothetical protein